MAPIKSSALFSLLIVEDDQATCDLLACMITEAFPVCTIYTAGNGVLGTLLFERFTPDIILTDINLPVMDGIELGEKIWGRTKSTCCNRWIILKKSTYFKP